MLLVYLEIFAIRFLSLSIMILLKLFIIILSNKWFSVSRNSNKISSQWLKASVLLFALTVLPLGVLYAKDYTSKTETYLEEVWEKLQTEVEAGTITVDDAEFKMTLIKKEAFLKAKTAAYFKKIWAKLLIEVEAGNISKEDAVAKMILIKKEAF